MPEQDTTAGAVGTLVIENPVWARGFTAAPNALLHARNVSGEAKLLFIVLLGYAWRSDRCWPGQRALLGDTGWSVNRLRKYLRELEAIGLLAVRRRPAPQTTLYTLKDLDTVPLRGSESDPIAPARDPKSIPEGSDSASKAQPGNRRDDGWDKPDLALRLLAGARPSAVPPRPRR